MINKLTSGQIVNYFLSTSLLLVIGLFLYSEYRTSDAPISTSASSLASPNTSSQLQTQRPIQTTDSEQQKNAKQAAQQVNDSVAQPDKALPIPAHQLKKIIAQERDKQSDLQQKIDSANQRISVIDQQFKQTPVSNSVQPATSGANQGAESTESENKQAISARLQHLRDHIDSKAEK